MSSNRTGIPLILSTVALLLMFMTFPSIPPVQADALPVESLSGEESDFITVTGVVAGVDEAAGGSVGPIAGVPVMLVGSDLSPLTNIAGEQIESALTDTEGAFVFAGVPVPSTGSNYYVVINPRATPGILSGLTWAGETEDGLWLAAIELNEGQPGSSVRVSFALTAVGEDDSESTDLQDSGRDDDDTDGALPEDDVAATQNEKGARDAGRRTASSSRIAPISFASGGSGLYHDIIDWVEWGDVNNQVVLWGEDPSESVEVESVRQIGSQTLKVVCTASDLDWDYPLGTDSGGNDTGVKLTPPLVAYTPGSWAGDALDDLYNIGGAGHAHQNQQAPKHPEDFTNPNQMVIGLANPNVNIRDADGRSGFVIDKDGTEISFNDSDSNGAKMSFNFSCSATLHDSSDSSVVDVPLEGLVFADAEASSSAKNVQNPRNGPEWVEATTSDAGVTWRIIEELNTCSSLGNAPYATASWIDGNTLRLGVQGQECAYQPNYEWPNVNPTGSGPMSIAFMEGATSARVGLQGRGYSAVAVGYVLAADFGDAPSSYGEAGALFQQAWEGGTVQAQGLTNVTQMGSSDELAKPAPPKTVILGERIDPESAYQASDDALGDDTDVLGDDYQGEINFDLLDNDEDALDYGAMDRRSDGAYELPIDAFTDGTFTINNIRCYGPASGTATVAGWIDWNASGVFDAAERAEVSCASGQQNVSLTWTVPGDADPEAEYTFMRLRIAKDAAEVAQPTGISTTGEVEDHRLKLPARVKIDKTWIVDGVKYDHVEPEGPVVEWLNNGWLAAKPTLKPDPSQTMLEWSQWRGDYRTLDTVSIGEAGVFVDPINLPGCRLVSSTLAGDGIDDPIDLALGEQQGSVILPKVHNEYEITNTVECDSGEIVWEKVDETKTERLAGSEWKLTGTGDFADAGIELEITDCIADTTAECTGPDKDPVAGSFRITDLPWGSYELVETKAPPGFLLDSTVHEIEVGMGSFSTVTIDLGKIVNEQQDVPDIPLTGGMGTHIYLIGGGVALVLVAGMLVRRRWVLGPLR